MGYCGTRYRKHPSRGNGKAVANQRIGINIRISHGKVVVDAMRVYSGILNKQDRKLPCSSKQCLKGADSKD